MSLWLTDDELFDLTGKRHRAKQIAVLISMRVKHRVRPDDSFPLVDRSQFEQSDLTTGNKKRQPDFSALQRTG